MSLRLAYIWTKGLRKLRGAAITGSLVHPTSKVEPGSNFANSTMARHSFCGYDCEISNADIGPFCSIANHVAIGGGRHPVEWVATSPVFYEGRDSVEKKFSDFPRPAPQRAVIGADVWIGYRAIVMQGVTVGHGAVVGAGAIVTRDVEPYSICGGSPAKHIRFRFDTELRYKLLESRWWELEDDVLEKCAHKIREPKQFLKEIERCA